MILVFGASGLIGSELISILSASGVPAIAVSRASSEAKPLPESVGHRRTCRNPIRSMACFPASARCFC